MNMMQFPQSYHSLCSSFQHAEQADDMLNVMLTQANKSALIAKLNSGFFSQKTLHSLLYNAFLEESPDVVATILTTKNYTLDVLATVILESLNNAQGDNEQERFISALLKNEYVKVKVLTTALHMVVRRGISLNNDCSLIDRLIKLATLTSEEEAQIASACLDIRDFLFFVPFIQASLSHIAHDNKIGIGHFLTIRDLLRYGQISRGFNNAMQDALRNRTACIEVRKMTEAVMVTLRKVNCLDLRVPPNADVKMSHIGQLVNLHVLDLKDTGTKMTLYGSMQYFEKLTHLHTLDFSRAYLSDGDLHHLKKLKNLQSLYLGGTKVTGAGLLHLANLTCLHTLNLSKANVTDVGLHHLAQLTHLHTLDLSYTEVTDAGLLHLEKLTHLQTLYLGGTKVTDAGLHHLKKLTHLHTLDLSFTAMTNLGLVHLENLTHLHTLDLWDTKVTDAGLPHLEKLTHLHSLGLVSTYVTQAGLENLKKLLPDLKVYQ